MSQVCCVLWPLRFPLLLLAGTWVCGLVAEPADETWVIFCLAPSRSISCGLTATDISERTVAGAVDNKALHPSLVLALVTSDPCAADVQLLWPQAVSPTPQLTDSRPGAVGSAETKICFRHSAKRPICHTRHMTLPYARPSSMCISRSQKVIKAGANDATRLSLVDPLAVRGSPLGLGLVSKNPRGKAEEETHEALGEPESDLLLAVLDRVGAVAWLVSITILTLYCVTPRSTHRRWRRSGGRSHHGWCLQIVSGATTATSNTSTHQGPRRGGWWHRA